MVLNKYSKKILLCYPSLWILHIYGILLHESREIVLSHIVNVETHFVIIFGIKITHLNAYFIMFRVFDVM